MLQEILHADQSLANLQKMFSAGKLRDFDAAELRCACAAALDIV